MSRASSCKTNSCYIKFHDALKVKSPCGGRSTHLLLNHDDKRKLIFIICDGNIIGSGEPPRIVLDILGVDPALDSELLLFKSFGDALRTLDYTQAYTSSRGM